VSLENHEAKVATVDLKIAIPVEGAEGCRKSGPCGASAQYFGKS
jgi:hypothetical protein